MSLSDASLVHASVWLLAQLPDTIVTRQVPIQGTWFDQFQAVLRTLMTLAILVLTVAVVPAAWNFRRSYSKISELLDRVYADVNPITHHASRIAENVDYVSTALRADVQRASATLTDANERLQEAIRLAEARARDFDALLAVVQEESEGAFVSTASTVRGVRTGMETLRDALHDTLRETRRAALGPLPPRRRRTRPADDGPDVRDAEMLDADLLDADVGDDVANELAAVDVRRTPTRGHPAVASIEPAGPATFGALDEIVDDEVEEPLLDDELLDDPDELSEEGPRHGEWSRYESEGDTGDEGARDQRPRVRPRRERDA